MTRVCYHSVIHGLGFYICFNIQILHAQSNKKRFFYVLYSDKTWVFNQSEHAQGSIYILILHNNKIILINNDLDKELKKKREEILS